MERKNNNQHHVLGNLACRVFESGTSYTSRKQTQNPEITSYEDLTITNNFIFCKVMENNPDLCKKLVEMITELRIKELRVITERTTETFADSHGVRLDVYATEENGRVFNVEMQTTNSRTIPKRTRYSQSTIDMNELLKGQDYENLPESYIIFITPFDPFGFGLHKYTFRSICVENKGLELGDMMNKVFICVDGDADDVSEEMKEFLSYLAGNLPNSDFTKNLERKVNETKRKKEWRVQYMTYEMEMRHREYVARKEGREEGRREAIFNIYCKGKSADEIADFMGLSVAEIRDIINEAESC